MGKNNKNKNANKVISNEEAKVEETVVDEAVSEEEVTDEVATTDEATVADEAKVEEEATDEVVDEEEVTDEVEEEDASAPVTKFAVYQDNRVVKIFNGVTHGADYKKIAKGLAERLQAKNPTSQIEAKAYFDKVDPEPDQNVVKIVNASNSLVREYSLATHGKDYAKIAAAFLEKHGAKRGYRVG
ncbi:hypothetical protein [Caudoviricetes sp.]|nr:hypothetical protein [Caudoviricetes sp.]